jgi:hypothetical protein
MIALISGQVLALDFNQINCTNDIFIPDRNVGKAGGFLLRQITDIVISKDINQNIKLNTEMYQAYCPHEDDLVDCGAVSSSQKIEQVWQNSECKQMGTNRILCKNKTDQLKIKQTGKNRISVRLNTVELQNNDSCFLSK